MKKFNILYSFDIKSKRTEEMLYWEREAFVLELKDNEELDTTLVKARVNQLAQDKANEYKTAAYVSHANYYQIEELKAKKTK